MFNDQQGYKLKEIPLSFVRLTSANNSERIGKISKTYLDLGPFFVN